MSVRTYTELISLLTFEERFRYLKLDGKIGEATFGFQRWVNQEFYHSSEWLSFRDDVIIRDNGCDLGNCRPRNIWTGTDTPYQSDYL